MRLGRRVACWVLVVAVVAVGTGGAVTAVGLTASASEPARSAPLRVLPLGDSITLGPDGRGGFGGWRAILWQRLVERDGLALQFVGTQHSYDPPLDHDGHGGWRTDQLREIVDGALAATTPDVVLLQAGPNDLAQGRTVAQTSAGLRDLAERVCADAPRAELVLATLLPIATLEPVIDAVNAGLPDTVAALQMRGCDAHLVDMHPAVALTDLYDGVHPDAAGYDAMADVWTPALLAAYRAPVPRPRRPLDTVDDDALHYVGAWRADAGRHRSGGTGDTATFTFRGTGAVLYGSTGPDGGLGVITVDGRDTEADWYTPDARDGVAVQTVAGLPEGEHTLAVRATGRAAPAASDAVVTIDRIAVTS